MKRIAFLFLVAISFCSLAVGATRPRYGGTLRVALQWAPNGLELPANSTAAEYWDAARVLSLVGDNLVASDAAGRPQPALATSWQSDANARRWEFDLRSDIKFQDGSVASAAAIAQVLGALHPDWTVRATRSTSGPGLEVTTESPHPNLLAELALPRNLILKRDASGQPIGTGAFRVVDFQPGKFLKLVANEECWAGRPYLDSIEIELGKSLRDQAVALELGRSDVIEAAPQVATSSHGRVSLPVELMALVFTPNTRAQDVRLREALALSIDRKPIQSVLLKGAAEPVASILPNWMTGYSSVFSSQANVQRARALLADSRQPALTLSYDPRDPQAQLIAERIVLNAREAGIALQVSLSGPDDVRLIRIPLLSSEPSLALREAARRLSLKPPGAEGNKVDDLYRAERTLLDGYPVIPLFHLPVASASSARVHGWSPDRLGGWNLADLWVENPR